MNFRLLIASSLSASKTMRVSSCRLLVALTLMLALSSQSTFGQVDDLMPSHDVKVSVNSGDIFNNGDKPEIVWTEDITVEGAEWVRLHFSYLVLAYDQIGNTSSTLRITSLKDGSYQILDGKTARQWYNSSAYFNGNRVRLELIAWPNGRMNRVTVDNVMAGEIPTSPESICDSNDDRTLSNDPRAGRTDGGCTGWLFDDRKNCFLTAGHCASSTNVMLFNVPLSNTNGSYNFPPPEDQYSVDQSSKQLVNSGIGSDWCYFGCFPNSNTGLSAFDAQGASYQLVLPPSPGGNNMIRITGFGSTSAPVNPQWNGAQKTQVGPYTTFNSTSLGYRTDTTGGNSGSPVIHENTGNAIGIHTHGGCGSGGSGNNWGTGANNGAFQNALANPQGICQGGVEFDYPNGRPSLINPSGGTTFRVIVTNGGEEPEPGTGLLHYDIGSGFQSVAMTEVSPNVYDAVFPATPCGSVVDYYVTAESDTGDQFSDPNGAPTTFYSVLSATNVRNAFFDNFQTNQGWSTSGDTTVGQWDRGVPAHGGTRGEPAADADGSGSCYVSGNAVDEDIDGGTVILTSPIMDASVATGEDAVISYYRWYSNDFGNAPNEDIFVVELSNDGGSTWTNLETVGPSGSEVSGGWFYKTFSIGDVLPPTNQMRIRFIASDLINGSVVEAAVDGVQIDIVECQSTVTAVPDSYDITQGEFVGGNVGDLAVSDNSNLRARKMASQVTGGVIVEFQSTSHTETPTALDFTLESSVLARRDVQQTIELFNYDTDTWEALDTRSASRTGDIVVTVTPGGDLSRFVQPGTLSIEARVRYLSPFQRQLYVTRMDQAIWTITN